MDNRKIYEVTGGTAMNIVKEIASAPSRFKDEAEKLRQRFGASEILCVFNRVVGARFEKRPKGWDSKPDGTCRPNYRCSRGINAKSAINFINAIAYWDTYLPKFFKGDTLHIDGRFVHKAHVFRMGDRHFVTIHKDSKCKPVDGMKKLGLSEFHAIKEAFEEQQRQAGGGGA